MQELGSVLAAIDEKLKVLDTITAVQAKQSRRLDVIQDKLGKTFYPSFFLEIYLLVRPVLRQFFFVLTLYFVPVPNLISFVSITHTDNFQFGTGHKL